MAAEHVIAVRMLHQLEIVFQRRRARLLLGMVMLPMVALLARPVLAYSCEEPLEALTLSVVGASPFAGYTPQVIAYNVDSWVVFSLVDSASGERVTFKYLSR